jgi:hypothetical protein
MTDPDIEAACEDITKGLKTHRGCSPGTIELLPCPFCASSSVDPEGWMSCDPDGSNKRTADGSGARKHPMRKSNLHKRMYAVSLEGVGIISGTMAYSRKAAIDNFTPHGNWEQYKRSGYRTVMARVQIIRRWALTHPSQQGNTP